MERIKNNKAITLIALIITIIILLIIAGVAISFTIGENGIFDKSKKSAEKYEMAEAKEQIELAIQGLVMEKIQKGEGFPTLEEIEKKLYDDDIITASEIEEDTLTVTTKKGYIVEITRKANYRSRV